MSHRPDDETRLEGVANQAAPSRDGTGEPRTAYRLRRAPRYAPFGLTGLVVGVLAGTILALSFSATSDYSIRTIIGYFATSLGLIGCLGGLGAAVLIERRRR